MRALPLTAVLVVAVAGCVAATSPAGSPVGSVAASPSPGTTIGTTPSVAATQTGSVAASATPAPPPQAEIVTAAATIPGDLGTYVIDGGGSDSPAFPFDALPALSVGTRDTIGIRFIDGVAIGDFQVVITAAADTAASAPQAVPATRSADGLTLTAGPLPAGRWVLAARLFRADGRGDGVTYWAVTVT